MKPLEVLFCGNSVYLCGLAANLRETQELRVSRVDEELDKVMPEIKILDPDVLIFEAASNAPAEEKALRAGDADLLIIAVHPQTDSLEVIGAGRHFSAPLDDLARVIRETAGGERQKRNGDPEHENQGKGVKQ